VDANLGSGAFYINNEKGPKADGAPWGFSTNFIWLKENTAIDKTDIIICPTDPHFSLGINF
jgi:hypothetical protein